MSNVTFNFTPYTLLSDFVAYPPYALLSDLVAFFHITQLLAASLNKNILGLTIVLKLLLSAFFSQANPLL